MNHILDRFKDQTRHYESPVRATVQCAHRVLKFEQGTDHLTDHPVINKCCSSCGKVVGSRPLQIDDQELLLQLYYGERA